MDSRAFLAGGGEMGERIRAMDWSRTPLGPVERWPQSLRSAVSIMLPSKAQIAIFWGPDLITLYNDAYRPVFGGKHPAALGKPIREAWGELWRAGLKELFDGVLGTGEAFWAQARPFFMERHGYLEETYFDVSYDPIRDESGRVAGLFCIVSDVTGRVVGERRLRLLRDLRGLANQALGLRDVYRAAGEVLAAYPEDMPFALLYGVERPGEAPVLMGRSGPEGETPTPPPLQEGELQVVKAEPPVRAGPWAEPIAEMAMVPFAAQGAALQGMLVAGLSTRRKLDADYRDFLKLAASSIASAAEAARRAEGERRRAEALAELDRAKTAFFSNVSHEFRTPLTLLLGPAEDLMAKMTDAPEDERAALQTIHRNGRRLLRLVNTLLDFARIEAGRAQASYEPTDLAALTADLASNFRSACERAGLRLMVDCPAAGEAYVDREMWEKIVLNLLSNAFKFTLQGEIAVALRRDGDAFRLEVRDTGSGIPEAALPRMFERFHRVEGAQGRSHEGSGIGLALVHELVKLHGGTIRVASRLGAGSTFTVSIPAGTAHLPRERIGARREDASTALRAGAFVDEALSLLPSGDGRPAAPKQGAPRVLLADDNADLREYARRLLAEHYEVEAVADGEAALAAARARRPDLVVTDVMMPKLDGFGLIGALRADEALRDIPVIALSARAGEEARIAGLGRGADDYLTKPFRARELTVRCEALLRSADIRREAEARVRAIVETTPECVKVVAADGTLLQMNAAGLSMVGAPSADAVLGRCIYEVIAPEDRTRFREFNERICAGERGRLEFDIVGLGGTRRHMETHAVPLARPQGGHDQLAITRDVTERKLAESALKASEERYRSVLGLMPVAVYTCEGPSGRITYFNEHAVKLWGRTPALGETGERFCACYKVWTLDGEFVPPAQTPMAIALREGTAFRDREAIVERPDGSRFVAVVNIDPLRDAEGRVVGAINVFYDVTERRRQEDRLRRSEARLGAEADALAKLNDASSRLWRAKSLPEGLEVILSATIELMTADYGNIQLLDGAVLKIAAQRGFKQDFLEFFREVSTRDDSAAGRVLRGGERIIIEDVESDAPYAPLRAVARAAGYRAVQTTPLLGRDGNPLGMISTHWAAPHRPSAQDLRRLDLYARQAADFIERCAADERLREGEQQLRLALEAGRMGAWEWHIGSNRVSWSPGLEALHGLPPGAFDGTYEGFRRDIVPEDLERVEQAIARTLQTGEEHRIEYRIAPPGGGTKWVEGRGKLFRDAGGNPERMVGVCVDATERKLAEAALLARARQQQAVASLGELALRERNLQKVFDQATASVADALGVEYCKVLELLPGGREVLLRAGVGWRDGLLGRARVSAGMDSQAGYTLASDTPVVVTDLRSEDRFRGPPLLTEHGVVSGMSCIIRGVDGVPWGVLGTHSTRRIEFTKDDVSFLSSIANVLGHAIQRERAESALRESDRRKDEFIAVLSHELRNPLAPLKSGLELLRLGEPLGGDRVREMMERQVGHLARLVDDLLESSRISRGLLELRREPVQIADALRAAVESAESLIHEGGHRLELDLPREPLWIEGDAVRLAQIFANLLNNAARYTPRGGRIWLHAARADDGKIRVSVRDSGVGLAPEAQARLFEMFARGERSSGLGIGLALARRLVEMHGGAIEAHSEGEGCGAEFTVTLPLTDAPARAEQPSVVIAGKGFRVLVADDNRDAAESLAALLQALGNDVKVAYDGIEAVAAARTFRPHVILLDIGMPRLDGYGAAREIRSDPHGRAVKIVALTGWGQEGDRRRVREAGFDAHLVKPAELDALRSVLSEVNRETQH